MTGDAPDVRLTDVLLCAAETSGIVAIVLAAGLGARLRAAQSDRPKGLTEIGGQPLIAHSVAALRRAGISDFVFVVGWKQEAYATWCAHACPRARLVENPEYATTGSLRSLLLGAAAVPGRDILVVESDLLYERRAPELLLASRATDVLLISDFTQSRDEVWVYGTEGAARLAKLTKTRCGDREPAGELVGLSRLSAVIVRRLTAAAAGMSPAAHYEDGLNAVCAEHPIALLRADGLAWCEIDDAMHLARARNEIWPRIVAAHATGEQPAA